MAAANVGSPMTSCHLATGSWLVIRMAAVLVSVLDDFHEIASLVGAEAVGSGPLPGAVADGLSPVSAYETDCGY